MYGNANVIVNNTYQHDALGNVTAKKTLSGFTQYSYDVLERMTKVVIPKGITEYAYDQSGNRTSKTVMDISGQIRKRESYVYDALNRMLTRHITDEGDRILKQNDFHEYTYDDQGNMTASKQYSIHDD